MKRVSLDLHGLPFLVVLLLNASPWVLDFFFFFEMINIGDV